MQTQTSINPRTFVKENKKLVESIVQALARKYHLRQEAKEDFLSEVFIKLLNDDGAVIRKFKGNSSIKTYLKVVIGRLFLDYRDRQWGRWRPSTHAKRLGQIAVLLEQYTHRDGCSFKEAFRKLKFNHGLVLNEADTYELFATLPSRNKRQYEDDLAMADFPGNEPAPDEVMATRQKEAAFAKAVAAVRASLQELPGEDRLILRLHFGRNIPLSKIALQLGRDPKPFYRTFPKILIRLRQIVEKHGVAEDMVKVLLR